MFKLHQQTLNKIKSLLLRKQREVDDELKSIEEDDPITVDAVPESSESGTESWQAEVHSRLSSLKEDLVGLSERIKSSLLKVNKGTYGKCEKCGKQIETARLEIIPTATFCMSCSKKPSKSRK